MIVFTALPPPMDLDSRQKVKNPTVDMQIYHWPRRAGMVYKAGERYMRLDWLKESPGLPLLNSNPVYLAMLIHFLKFSIIAVIVAVLF